ncbi:lycopene cyclase domain-containing protein [Mycobacterium sp. Y57]|uniref:lycopene cyclase domain-containing protein n=1 Tax=Mycolicibacterium xanthum TaxID=2796469 RepID=UPI001C852C3F|nr:lycopene cyclase domain-containing protein [Mycolicibacterium xanthum]MBX7433036.1 lycopene cyclase domain-containing protein [Mycolicibacterium xanthum]
MDRWQYLIVLGACLLITAPLEFFGAGVYRRPRLLAAALLPVAAVFLVWDVIAVAADVWWYNPLYITGVIAPGDLPLEEVLFFVVIPLCGLLTYNAVDTILSALRRQRGKAVQNNEETSDIR